MRARMRAILFLLVGAWMALAEELPDFDTLWNFQDPAATETKFRELLPREAPLDWELQLRTQIARTLGLQGKFAEAHAELDGVEERLTDGTKPARVRYLLERGRCFNSAKEPTKATPLFREAWDLARACGEPGRAVDAAHMLAIAEPDPARKLAWNLEAMRYAEASKDERALRWLGALYNNIGWDYHAQGKYAEALEVHRKGWEWHRARDPGSTGTLIAKWSVAKQLRCLGRADEALPMQRELLAEWEKRGEPDGFVEEEIGECLLLRGRPDEAAGHFRRAWELLQSETWIAEAEPARWERLRKLAGG